MDTANSNSSIDVLAEDFLLTFSWFDYTLFGLMLGLSILIGIYFGFFGKQDSATEYLLGGKVMGVFPVAMSLVASHLSGITLLGIPSEVYRYGTQYWMCTLSALINAVIISYVYLPVFYVNQVTTSYEYLKLRFDNRIRLIASILFIIAGICHIPMVIFIPALAFNQVTGINLYYVAPIVCAICIFYTTIGGIKAVVWTDTLQFSVTIGAMVAVFFLGTASAGGFSEIWQKSLEGDRIEFFNMDLDPTARTTFWGISVGLTLNWVSQLGVSQGSVQRFLAVPSMNAAKRSVIIFCIGVIVTKSLSCFTGLIMYAKYFDCDPLLTGKVKKPDQVLPYYVLDVARHIPGLSGLFISGVFSTALSAMSANLNTLAGVIYEDFIALFIPQQTEKRVSDAMKLIVVVVGVLCVGLVLVVERLGGILQISVSLSGMSSGPLLGLFTLGMLFPSANSKGALYGSIIALLFTGWIVIGTQMHIALGNIKHLPKASSADNCTYNFTLPDYFFNNTIEDLTPHEEPFYLFRLSFYHYATIGAVLVVVVGLIVSKFTKSEDDPPVDKDLLSPVIHWMLPEKETRTPSAEYRSVESALNIINANCQQNEKEKLELELMEKSM